MWISFLFLLFTIIIFCSVLDVFFINSLMKKYIVAFLCVLLIGMAGLRDGVDRDYGSYVYIYENVPTLNDICFNDGFQDLLATREENGFLFINAIVKFLFDSHEMMFGIIAGITMLFYFFSFKKYSLYPVVALLVYASSIFIVKEVTQIRQGLAMGIFLFSIRYVLGNNFKKFFMFIGLAATFHISILSSLVIYPMRNVDWNFRRTMLLLVACCLITQIDWIDQLLSFLKVNEFGFRILDYEGSEYAENNDLTMFWKNIFIFLFFGMLAKYIKPIYKYYNIMMSIYGVSLLYIALFHEFVFIGYRLAVLMLLSRCFLFPALIMLYQNRFYRLAVLFFISAISVIAIKSNLTLLM